MRYPDLPDEEETRVNPHHASVVRVIEETVATCPHLEPSERQMLTGADLGLFFSCVWPLVGREELCGWVPFCVLSVVRDDRFDRGDTAAAAALDKAVARELEHALAVLPATSAQRIARAAATVAGAVRTPSRSLTSLDAYLEYQYSCDGARMSMEFAAAGARRAYGPLLDAPEAQEFLRLCAYLIRLANDILGAPREMSQKGDSTNAITLAQQLTGHTPQQALDACVGLHHSIRERYHHTRQALSRREDLAQMCTDMHLTYSGSLFMTKRLPRYHQHWKSAD
ncbi:hypothetical protein AV521_45850 [Streptomyces sp. IMTB 2501]|uniref:terpene synthase family protein n=1 Tax=Streptomyces sp. IMTB 2501 TaxID=1776340 RepID=UPI00096D6241|nr:terpene synthase family protein [Streptomyces sp. IMTB 2501]OLZ59233.1 hypothetical protein AV521_45850 [Streptomyces sp. IMTB 2501]